MKVTKSQLKQIIQEEVEQLDEGLTIATALTWILANPAKTAAVLTAANISIVVAIEALEELVYQLEEVLAKKEKSSAGPNPAQPEVR